MGDVEEAKQELLAPESQLEGDSVGAASLTAVIGEKMLLSQHGDMIDTIEEEEDIESPVATPNNIVKEAVVIMEEDGDSEDGPPAYHPAANVILLYLL